ncbi:hypothetical protein MOMOMMO210B_19080 [Morganella morganii]|uniref:hypothetical protein n=1 Tax=Morganella morganii TaxID=582 RepID=UPI003B2342CA
MTNEVNKPDTRDIKDYVGFVLADINIIATNMIPGMAREGATLQEIKDRIDLLTAAFLYTRLKVLGEGRKLIEDINNHQALLDQEIANLIKANERNYSVGDKFI